MWCAKGLLPSQSLIAHTHTRAREGRQRKRTKKKFSKGLARYGFTLCGGSPHAPALIALLALLPQMPTDGSRKEPLATMGAGSMSETRTSLFFKPLLFSQIHYLRLALIDYFSKMLG